MRAFGGRGRAQASYSVDLAGKMEGDSKAEAVVNDPLPPRLFVMRRDGSAVELLRRQDVRDFERLASLGALRVESSGAAVVGDPSSLPARQWTHHVLYERSPWPAFAAAFASGRQCPWQTRPLPVCARASAESQPRTPAHEAAPRVIVRRVWHERPPLDEAARRRLLGAVSRCAHFRAARAHSVDRFAVHDDRDPQALAV